MHIEAAANGLGAQSILMWHLACTGKVPATLSITADTGWENDRLWNDGTRSTAREYYEYVVVPMTRRAGLECVMVEALMKDGTPAPPLGEWLEQHIKDGKLNNIKVPLFGSNGGRLGQSCTQRKKITAIRQELRRRGATTARMAQGLHRGEIHRMKGRNGRKVDEFFTLDSLDAKWQSHYYPLIDIGLFRADVNEQLDSLGIPYLMSSECDGCPHQDWPRWARHTPETIDHLADLEAKMNGEFFFTSKRIPLKDALALMKAEFEAKIANNPLAMFEAKIANNPLAMFEDADFGCSELVCGL